jgi:tight adherence protein C
MTALLWISLAGLALGVWLVVRHVPTPAPPSLRDRVTPYVGRRGALWRESHQRTFVASWQPQWVIAMAHEASRRIAWLSGGDGSALRRIDTLGGTLTVEQFRLEQVLWGLAAGGAASLLMVVRGAAAADWLPSLVVIALASAAGILARDRALTVAVQRRADRMRSELPTVIELLAMAVAAGSGLLAALERTSRIGAGTVATELGRTLDDVRVGLPLVPALQRMADRNGVGELQRFVDALVAAVDRGTPLADVLVAQAMDARESSRRALIEAGGRKEIAMMVPVVFLVLPISVLFVLFPGFYGLSLGS